MHVTGQYHAQDRTYSTSIERIALNDHDWSSESWLGTSGFCKISPPNFALTNYHSVLFKVLRAARRVNSSG